MYRTKSDLYSYYGDIGWYGKKTQVILRAFGGAESTGMGWEGVSYETVYTNNVEAGTAKATVTVTDPNYSGTASAEFRITGAPAEDISSFTVEPIDAQTYTGSPLTPPITGPGMVWIRAEAFPMKESRIEKAAAPPMTHTL